MSVKPLPLDHESRVALFKAANEYLARHEDNIRECFRQVAEAEQKVTDPAWPANKWPWSRIEWTVFNQTVDNMPAYNPPLQLLPYLDQHALVATRELVSRLIDSKRYVFGADARKSTEPLLEQVRSEGRIVAAVSAMLGPVRTLRDQIMLVLSETLRPELPHMQTKWLPVPVLIANGNQSRAQPSLGTDASLEAYYAEIRAVEDEWYSRCKSGRVIGTSGWDGNIEKLRDIDSRHGVQPDDSRVYSIAAYQAEQGSIQDEWRHLCRKNGWMSSDPQMPYFQEFWAAEGRYWARLDDCRARHFPGLHSLDERTIDTIPKLWAHITGHLLVVSEMLAVAQPEQSGQRPSAHDSFVKRVYSLMHRLKISGAPPPPYEDFAQKEVQDELIRIANILEEEDAKRRASATSGTAASTPLAPLFVSIEDIDSFVKVRGIPASAVKSQVPVKVPEAEIKRRILSILGEPFERKDWGGEQNDIFSTRVVLRGQRQLAAFLLKGPATKGKLTIAKCGKDGSQIQRLFQSSADVFVIQYNGEIDERVIEEARQKTEHLRGTGRKSAVCLIVDGVDTARLLAAYGEQLDLAASTEQAPRFHS